MDTLTTMRGGWMGWKAMWALNMMPKLKLFLWKLLWKRLPMSDCLSKVTHSYPLPCLVFHLGTDSCGHSVLMLIGVGGMSLN